MILYAFQEHRLSSVLKEAPCAIRLRDNVPSEIARRLDLYAHPPPGLGWPPLYKFIDARVARAWVLSSCLPHLSEFLLFIFYSSACCLQIHALIKVIMLTCSLSCLFPFCQSLSFKLEASSSLRRRYIKNMTLSISYKPSYLILSLQ